MKELKHLIYFENLLEDANNELVRKAERKVLVPRSWAQAFIALESEP